MIPRASSNRAATPSGEGIALRRALVILIPLAVWEVASRVGMIDPLTAPAPSQVVMALAQIAPSRTFARDAMRTLSTVVGAFALGAAVAYPIGILLWRLPVVSAIVEPYLATLYAMPLLIVYPVVLAILGLGPAPIVTIASVMAFIPIATGTLSAFRSVDARYLRLSHVLCCTFLQRFRRILLPASLPLLVPGVKMGFTYALVGSLAMEFLLAERGLGFRIGMTYREFKTTAMFAHILAVVLVAAATYIALSRIEARVRRDIA